MIKEILNRWEKCGLKSLDKFSFKKHYSVMFDDEIDGFDHLFDIPINEMKKIEGHSFLEEKIDEIDQKIELVGSLMETFIKEQFVRDVPFNSTISEVMEDYVETLKVHYNEVIRLKEDVNEYLKDIVY